MGLIGSTAVERKEEALGWGAWNSAVGGWQPADLALCPSPRIATSLNHSLPSLSPSKQALAEDLARHSGTFVSNWLSLWLPLAQPPILVITYGQPWDSR